MNVSEFLSEYAISYENLEDEYRIRLVNRLVVSQKVEIGKLLKSKRSRNMPASLFQKSIDMVSSFLDKCNAEIDISHSLIEYDPFVNDSISIYFPKKQARVNLYFNEDCPIDEDNFEEIYFSFVYNEQRHLVNDTMDNIMPLVKRILNK